LQIEIYKAREAEIKKFGDKLNEEYMKGNLFKIAKQMVRKIKMLLEVDACNGRDGKIVVDHTRIKQVWKKSFQKLLHGRI
jgi:hypothetical protein